MKRILQQGGKVSKVAKLARWQSKGGGKGSKVAKSARWQRKQGGKGGWIDGSGQYEAEQSFIGNNKRDSSSHFKRPAARDDDIWQRKHINA